MEAGIAIHTNFAYSAFCTNANLIRQADLLSDMPIARFRIFRSSAQGRRGHSHAATKRDYYLPQRNAVPSKSSQLRSSTFFAMFVSCIDFVQGD